jgi:hypothetical protein
MTQTKAAIVALTLLLAAGFAAAEQIYLNTDLQFNSPVEGMSGMHHGWKTAEEKSDSQAPSISQASQAVTEVGNTVCPITGEPVGSMQKGAHVDYKGQRVGLCCPGCKTKFLKNGEASLKKAQEQAAQAKKAAEGKQGK